MKQTFYLGQFFTKKIIKNNLCSVSENTILLFPKKGNVKIPLLLFYCKKLNLYMDKGLENLSDLTIKNKFGTFVKMMYIIFAGIQNI